MSADAPRQFVDTNVLLYAYDSSTATKHDLAKSLIDRLWRERAGALSIQVLQEFFVNATTKVAEPMEISVARQQIRRLGTWTSHSPSVADVLAAIDIHRDHRISFWDAMIITAAQAAGAAVVWSEDLNADQSFDGLTVRNPFRDR